MNTLKILTSQAKPGMIVSDDVYTKDLHLIIAKDTALTDNIITRLKFYSITEFSIYSDVDIDDPDTEYVESTFYNDIKRSEPFIQFKKSYDNSVENFKNTMNDLVEYNKEINPDDLLSEVSNILYQCNTNIELFNMLQCMRDYWC